LGSEFGFRAPFFDRHDVLAFVAVPPLVDPLAEVLGIKLPKEATLPRTRRADPPLMLQSVERFVWRNVELFEPRSVLDEEVRLLVFDGREVTCASLFNCPTRGFHPASTLLGLVTWAVALFPEVVVGTILGAVVNCLVDVLGHSLVDVRSTRHELDDRGSHLCFLEVDVAL